MSVQQLATDPHGRRGFLVRLIQATYAVIGATLAFVVGGAVVAPSFSRREPLWLRAGDVPQLDDDTPMPVTLRIARPDGASEVVDRRVVYLVKSGRRGARARFHVHAPGVPHAVQSGDEADRVPVSWRGLRHEGQRDRGAAAGAAAPRCRRASRTTRSWCRCSRDPPRPRLARLAHRLSRAVAHAALRRAAERHRVAVHDRQRGDAARRLPVHHRRRAVDVLRAGALAGLRQRAVHHDATCRLAGCCAACITGARASSWSRPSSTCCACSSSARTRRRAR